MLETLLVVFLAPACDGRRDQPRAREADARHAHRDADLVARDRPRQAAERADLRLPPDRRLGPAHRGRVRLRRRRPRTTSCAATSSCIATALGLGSFGLFCSSIVKRTQAATVITVFGVLAMTLGSVFVLYFWNVMAEHLGQRPDGARADQGPRARGHRLPQPVPRPGRRHLRHPDRRTATGAAGTPRIMGPPRTGSSSPNSDVQAPARRSRPRVPSWTPASSAVDIRRPADVTAFGVSRDPFWPKTVVAWLILSVVLLVASIQLVSPTRRWRPRRPGGATRTGRRRSRPRPSIRAELAVSRGVRSRGVRRRPTDAGAAP